MNTKRFLSAMLQSCHQRSPQADGSGKGSSGVVMIVVASVVALLATLGLAPRPAAAGDFVAVDCSNKLGQIENQIKSELESMGYTISGNISIPYVVAYGNREGFSVSDDPSDGIGPILCYSKNYSAEPVLLPDDPIENVDILQLGPSQKTQVSDSPSTSTSPVKVLHCEDSGGDQQCVLVTPPK